MELVQLCKKHGSLEGLSQFLQKLIDYHEKKNSFAGIGRMKIQDNVTIQVVDSSRLFVNLFAFSEDDDEDVVVKLDIQQIRVLRLFVEHFGETTPMKHMRIGL